MPKLEVLDKHGNPIEISEKERREILCDAMGIGDAELTAIEDIENGGNGDLVAVDEDGTEHSPNFDTDTGDDADTDTDTDADTSRFSITAEDL